MHMPWPGLGLWQDCRKKVPAFFDFAGTFSIQGQPRPITALFTAQSGLTRELLSTKFYIDPRTSLSKNANTNSFIFF